MNNIIQNQQLHQQERLTIEQGIALVQPSQANFEQGSPQQLLNQLRKQEKILAIQAHLNAIKAQQQSISPLLLAQHSNVRRQATPMQRPVVPILVPVPTKLCFAPTNTIALSAPVTSPAMVSQVDNCAKKISSSTIQTPLSLQISQTKVEIPLRAVPSNFNTFGLQRYQSNNTDLSRRVPSQGTSLSALEILRDLLAQKLGQSQPQISIQNVPTPQQLVAKIENFTLPAPAHNNQIEPRRQLSGISQPTMMSQISSVPSLTQVWSQESAFEPAQACSDMSKKQGLSRYTFDVTQKQKIEALNQMRPIISQLPKILPKIDSEKLRSVGTSPQLGAESIHNETQAHSDGGEVVDQLETSPSPFVKDFEGIPAEWHEVVEKRNESTKRLKLYFRCKYQDCTAIFSKSCNLRDHFRKHTAARPYRCDICDKTFTQSGNLGRHYKNLHNLDRKVAKLTSQKPFLITKQPKIGAKPRASKQAIRDEPQQDEDML